jgi:hypothetical protein
MRRRIVPLTAALQAAFFLAALSARPLRTPDRVSSQTRESRETAALERVVEHGVPGGWNLRLRRVLMQPEAFTVSNRPGVSRDARAGQKSRGRHVEPAGHAIGRTTCTIPIRVRFRGRWRHWSSWIAAKSDALIHVARRDTVAEWFWRRRPDPRASFTESRNLLWPADPRFVEQLARLAGGTARHVRDDESMVGTFRQILDEFRQSYILHYQPAGVPAGGWHTLAVRVTRPGNYAIQARRGYFGG